MKCPVLQNLHGIPFPSSARIGAQDIVLIGKSLSCDSRHFSFRPGRFPQPHRIARMKHRPHRIRKTAEPMQFQENRANFRNPSCPKYPTFDDSCCFFPGRWRESQKACPTSQRGVDQQQEIFVEEQNSAPNSPRLGIGYEKIMCQRDRSAYTSAPVLGTLSPGKDLNRH